jgi:hypothetical protein
VGNIVHNLEGEFHRRLRDRVCARLSTRCGLRSESGFTLMEAVIAMTLFALIAAAMLSVLTAGVSAQRLSRQRTIAEQAANAEVEYIRTLAYSSVGNPGGNPSGTVQLSRTVAQVLGSSYSGLGLTGTVTTQVTWNNNPNDKVATAYRNAAFYKKVTITVIRTSDGKQLSKVVTYVSQTNGGTGVNEAEIDLQVVDIGNNTPISGQLVNLTSGPSSPLSDTTDSGGNIIFPALTANPTSGATAYYNLGLTPPSGYTLLKDDDIAQTPASSNAHVQLAPSQTFSSTMRVYKGSTITVALVDQSTGAAFTGNATVTLSTTLRGSAASQTLSYSGAPVSTSTFAGEPVIPSPSPVISGGYTAAVSNGFLATSVNKSTVPNTYPSDLTSTFTLTGYATGTLTATVTWGGVAVSGATVTLTGGPISTNQTAVTNASGVATFTDLPAGSGYTLTATKSGQTSSTASATVTAGTTTNVPIAMPSGSVTVTVTSAGSALAGATVQLTGGNIPAGGITAGTATNSSGQVTIANVPVGSGVTVTATAGSQTGSTSGQTVTAAGPNNFAVAMTLGTFVVTANQPSGTIAPGATVTLTGGPASVNLSGTADSTGKITFVNLPAGSTYTIGASRYGTTATNLTNQSVTGGSTTNVTINIGAYSQGSIKIIVQKTGPTNCSSTQYDWTISGGPFSFSQTGLATTGAGGTAGVLGTFSAIPTGSPYTVTVSNHSVPARTGSQSAVVVTSGGTTSVTINVGATC